MNTADLQFNIIYVRHTVASLSPMLHSLLKWSDCRYRLVSNGCTDEEKKLLQSLCSENDRLDYLEGPAADMLDHGSMLTWLHQRTESPWFCFMDSDILAAGPFLDDLVAQMDGYAVVSSGHPLWHIPEDIVLRESHRRLHGIHFLTEDGRALSSTYFAIYDNQILTDTIKRSGVDFRACYYDHVPVGLQEKLREANFNMLEFDTGKLLMALMYADGHRFRVVELDNVHHIGGFTPSSEIEPPNFFRSPADRLAISVFGGLLAGPLLGIADSFNAMRYKSPGMTRERSNAMSFGERKRVESRFRRRLNTARYFQALLRQLSAGQPAPEIPKMGNSVIEQRITQATAEIERLYRDTSVTGPSN